ncbi:N-acetyltransferase [Caproiciproducens sp. AGMB10547]|uniref:N-acetyltransferase n=1 Tax=Caproiciproducens faecalis TaxID=2820301 RepID=A0ABS7DPU7_9FIRM|nr:GNAT family N-acetyltransferase [Caproiciproducens faecalis]MBW7573297.1 N-acetyltransferase [Caproiciproducens faecalis]
MKLELIYEKNRIYAENESHQVIAEVTFPDMDEQTVNIDHTFVDDSLRGQGVAGKLMEASASLLREQKRKAVLTCSYAVKWFDSHPEYCDIRTNKS